MCGDRSVIPYATAGAVFPLSALQICVVSIKIRRNGFQESRAMEGFWNFELWLQTNGLHLGLINPQQCI